MNDIQIIGSNPSDFRYGQKECCFIKANMTVWYNFIMLTNNQTCETNISEFTEFFYSKPIINRAINTKKDRYGSLLVSFFNYIFLDREKPLKDINELTFDIGNEFLNKYAWGELSKRKDGNGNNVTRSHATINIAEFTLMNFYKWLFYKKDRNNIKKRYKLKYVHAGDFINGTKLIKNKAINVLESKFTVEYPQDRFVSKIESPSELMVYLLIDIARQFEPMISLAIAFQAFTGIRRGETCQMTKGRVNFRRYSGFVDGLYIDLRHELLLRSDGVRTGEIKRHRVQIAYPAFFNYIYKLYSEHIELIRQKGLENNEYGALFFDNNDNAMTTDTYARKFNNLIPKLMDRLNEIKNNGNINASRDYGLLCGAKITPHSLRDFFSEYVAQRESPAMLAVYRGDLSLKSALTYLRRARSTIIEIQNIQNSFSETYEKIMGKPFL